MSDLLIGIIEGFNMALLSIPMIISALIGYGSYNHFRSKLLVVLVGIVGIVIFSHLTRFSTFDITDCDRTGCHYIETGAPITSVKTTGILLVTLLTGFGLGIFLAHNFPWHKEQEEKMLTSKEVAEILQIPESTIINWVTNKHMFGIKYDNGYAEIPQFALIDWLRRFSKLNSIANRGESMHWINKTMMEKVHLIRAKKEAAI